MNDVIAGRPEAAESALGRLVGDVTVFASDVWGRRPLLTQAMGEETPLAGLLTEDAVDELLSTRGLRAPFVRVAKDGSTLPQRSFTSGGGVGAGVADQVSDDRLHRLFEDGATIVLQGLHRTWPPVIRFAQALAGDLGHPVQANAYITPPQSRGFSAHYDVHDVFVLQVFGSKRWTVHSPVRPAPLRDEPWTDHEAEVAAAAHLDPLLDVVLTAGDCLYLPRGFIHSAQALGAVSGHLTLGVHPWTDHAVAQTLLESALRAAEQDAQARAALPVGIDVGVAAGEVTAAVDRARGRLHAALDAVDPQAVAEALDARLRNSQRAAPFGPLAQTRAVTELTAETPVIRRDHLGVRVLEGTEGSVRLRTRVGQVDVPADEAAGIELLLDGRPITPADLPLPDAAALSLVRRLMLGGLLVPLPVGDDRT